MRTDWPLTRPPRPRPLPGVPAARRPSDGRVAHGLLTRRRIIETGRALFSEHGFADASTLDIAAGAGVSRGALYHHFADKQALFAAVYEDVERSVVARILECWQVNEARPHWERMRYAVRTYFEAATDPAVRRILMVEGPAVLGAASASDATTATACRLLLEGLEIARRDGLIDEHIDLPAVAHLLFGSFAEAAQWIASARDGADASERAAAVADRFLDAFSADARP